MSVEPSTFRRKLLTYRDAAEVLGVSERTCFTLVKRGELRAVKVGFSIRIDPADLDAFIERSKTGGRQ